METLIQEIRRLEMVIRDRDTEIAKLDTERATVLATVTELEVRSMPLLARIAAHGDNLATIEAEHAAFLAELKTQYETAVNNSRAHKHTLLQAETEAVNLTRTDLLQLETERTKIRTAADGLEDQARRLRHGRYADAKRRLPELRERQAKRAAEQAAHREPDPDPSATVQIVTARTCDACGQIAKPWVLSRSGAALCLGCATGQTGKAVAP
jgi:chromosome segregation ATPase